MQDDLDWWTNLSVLERRQYRSHEDRLAEKIQRLADAKKQPRHLYWVKRLSNEVLEHQDMLEKYRERGVQRAKLGCKPKPFREKRITHMAAG